MISLCPATTLKVTEVAVGSRPSVGWMVLLVMVLGLGATFRKTAAEAVGKPGKVVVFSSFCSKGRDDEDDSLVEAGSVISDGSI